MQTKQKIRYTADLGITILLPLLMAYSLVGESAHEWLGMAMLLLLVVHHVLNRSWIKHLTKGKYSGLRLVQTGLNVLLLVMMIGAMVSGILMSRYVFGFLHIRWGMMWTQSVHLFCTYWSFLLMSLHLGLHWAILLKLICPNAARHHIFFLRCMAAAIAVLGIAASIRNRLTDYLFLKTHFVLWDVGTTLTSFLLDYLCIMGLFVCIGYYLGKAVSNISRKNKVGKDVLQ